MDPGASAPRRENQTADDDQEDGWFFLSSESALTPSPEVSRDEHGAEDGGKLKSRLVEAWNSVRYGWSWKQKSKFSRSSAVVLLGKSFQLRDEGEKERFRRCFSSLLWLTYRRGFPPLPGGSLTSDSGWGCVLRTGQMLLARGLMLHLMPTGWTWSVSHRAVRDDLDLLRSTENMEPGWKSSQHAGRRPRKLSLGSLLDRPPEETHRELVAWFADLEAAPYGIHRLVELGKSSGKRAGDWYGPSIVAHILRKAVSSSAGAPGLAVYVAQDCTVYLQDVRTLCEQPRLQLWKAVILLVPVRLGSQELNPAYIGCVKKLLSLEHCIGIVGGKPKHSLFFVGFQDEYLLYLDPHYCQPTVDVRKPSFPLESFHCKYPRKMSFSRMDPSCTIGFFARGQKDFEALRRAVNEALSTSAETYPMFIFAEGGRGAEEEEWEGSRPPADTVTFIQRRAERRRTDSMDEFVVL